MKKSIFNARLPLAAALFIALNLCAVRAISQEKPAGSQEEPVVTQEKPSATNDAPRYRDASLPIQDRVADLLARMTLE